MHGVRHNTPHSTVYFPGLIVVGHIYPVECGYPSNDRYIWSAFKDLLPKRFIEFVTAVGEILSKSVCTHKTAAYSFPYLYPCVKIHINYISLILAFVDCGVIRDLTNDLYPGIR